MLELVAENAEMAICHLLVEWNEILPLQTPYR